MLSLHTENVFANANEKCLTAVDVKQIQNDLQKELFKKLKDEDIAKIKELDTRAKIHFQTKPFAEVAKQNDLASKVSDFKKYFSDSLKTRNDLDEIRSGYKLIFPNENHDDAKFIFNHNEYQKYPEDCYKEKLEEPKIQNCAKFIDRIFTKSSEEDNTPQVVTLFERTDPTNRENIDVFNLMEKKLDKKNYISYLNLLNYTKNRYLQESTDFECGLRYRTIQARCDNLNAINRDDKALDQILKMYGPLMGANIGAEAKKSYDDFNLDKSCKEFLTGFLKENPKSNLSKICKVIKTSAENRPKTAKEHYDAGRVPTYDYISGVWTWEEPKSMGTMIAGTAAQVIVGEFLPFWMNQKFIVEPSINYSLNQALDLKMGSYLQNLAYQNWMNTVMFPTTLNFWNNGTAKGFGF